MGWWTTERAGMRIPTQDKYQTLGVYILTFISWEICVLTYLHQILYFSLYKPHFFQLQNRREMPMRLIKWILSKYCDLVGWECANKLQHTVNRLRYLARLLVLRMYFKPLLCISKCTQSEWPARSKENLFCSQTYEHSFKKWSETGLREMSPR